jgi:pimeloyl-ACP methyl ester carboxylesterase
MEQSIDLKGKKINYKVSGEGDCLVLLHGFLESLMIWDDFARTLSKNFKIITIDLPGHGKSDVISEVHSMELMAKVVKEVLDHCNISKCTMAGHSMGGYVTLAFAEKFEEMLTGLVLFHSQAGADSPESIANRNKTISLVENDRTGFIRQFIPDLFASSNRQQFNHEIDILKQHASGLPKASIIAALSGMRDRKDTTGVLRNISKPVMIILGKEDKRIPLEHGLKQASMPDHCEVLILGNTGHMGYIEAREQTLFAIRDFACRVNKSSLAEK